jgi:hypothetical protein
MTNITKWDCYTYGGAAEVLGVPVWRLRYAVDSGYLPRPGVVFKRRAMFAPSQIEWMRAYFDRADRRPTKGRSGKLQTNDAPPPVTGVVPDRLGVREPGGITPA